MEKDTRVYEFGFLLSGLLPEAGVLSLLEKIEKIFEGFDEKLEKNQRQTEKFYLIQLINKKKVILFFSMRN